MNNYKEIGERLRNLRGELSIHEYTKRLNCTAWTYLRYEKGQRPPSIKILVKIAKTFNASLDWIVLGKPNNSALYPNQELTSTRREKLLKIYGHRCAVCGVGGYDRFLVVSHIQPLTLGGTSRLDNLILLCQNCSTQAKDNVISAEKLKLISKTQKNYSNK
jgi:transcriptional regulator with XRE-family HTH domain